MGRIGRGKKMGRPSKSDLANRNAAVSEKDLRRSHRRRNVKYVFDYDDYIDDDDDYYELMKKEKKLKQLLNLQDEADTGSGPVRTRIVDQDSEEGHEDEDDNKPLKRRKIDDDEVDGYDDDEENEGNEVDDGDDDEVREQKDEEKGLASPVTGTLTDLPSGLPLPDTKTLELILDKLQKKDIYGVYAEPVDPDELPDYHDVIQHPMDFATVRKKLGNGSYSSFEQFESDVFLICSNAMQYNAPDTIYYKQARTIQELAQRKFQKVRMNIERPEKELKSEQKTKSNSLAKKQMKKSLSRTVPEPGSDFSSCATLATAGDLLNKLNSAQDGGCERPDNADGLLEGNFSVIDNNLDKAEDLLPGKCLVPRFGRKPSIHDENRRATYSLLNQPVVRSESIFTTFDSESKQLVPVGLHADHSYARSLARFSATLGTVAWKVASQRIEQALPAGVKFGRGWVGEYEPLPTPVLMLENCTLKGPAFTNSDCTGDRRKNDKSFETVVTAKEDPVNGPIVEGKLPPFNPAGIKPPATSTSTPLTAKEQPVMGTSLERNPSAGTKVLTSVGANYQPINSQSRNFIKPEQKFMKQVELNNPHSANQSSSDYIAERQGPNGSELLTSRSMEMVARSRNFLQSASFKRPNNNGVTTGGLPNGKVVINSSDSSRMVSSPSDSFPGQMARSTTYGQEQGLGDPVQMMRTLGEKAQNQRKSSNHSPVDTLSVVSGAPSMRRDDPGNAAAAARAWMPVGAGAQKPGAENSSAYKNLMASDSLYSRTRDLQPQVLQFRGELPISGMHFQPEKNSFPPHALVPPPVRMGNEAQFQSRPMLFPQLMSADMSRFQLQTHWRGPNPQAGPSLKQETLPPDLNIGFQSSGSPVRQSTGILVDSQQPDLALQL